MKKTTAVIIICILLLIGGYLYLRKPAEQTRDASTTPTTQVVSEDTPIPSTAASVAGRYEVQNIGSNAMAISVYQESDASILFYLGLYERGNLGGLYGRATQTAPHVFTFYKKESYGVCNFTMTFANDSVTLHSLLSDNNQGCGFGNGVSSDGAYSKDAGDAPLYFTNGEGTKIYFKDTPPEKY